MIIQSRAPLRISFAGGGTDISPYCEKYGGCALNATINKYAWATLKLRKDKEIHIESYDFKQNLVFKSIREIRYDGKLDLIKAVVKNMPHIKTGINVFLRCDVIPKSGLGSSAAAFVAMIGAFNYLLGEERLGNYEIAELAYDLERNKLGNKGGRQDQYASVFGGINFIEFEGNDFARVNPIRVLRDHVLELEKNLVLVNIGEREKSGDIILDQVHRFKDKDMLIALKKTKETAIEMKHTLARGDLDHFGNLLHLAWQEKKKFSKMISNEYIDKLYDLALKHGALGGKITGAGGGGHMLFYCRPNHEQMVSQVLRDAGAKAVDFTFDMNGLETWEVNK